MSTEDPDDFNPTDHECDEEHSGYGPDTMGAGIVDIPSPVWFRGETPDGRALTWQRHNVVIPPEFRAAGDASARPRKGEWHGDPELVAAIEPLAAPYRFPDVRDSVAAIMLEVVGPGGSVIDSNGNSWRSTDAEGWMEVRGPFDEAE